MRIGQVMRLFIAEKPSLAKAIASNLGSGSAKDGYIELSSGDIVTWCYGHLLESLKPEEYNSNLKAWRLDDLPIKIDSWRLKPRKDAIKQLNVIERLIKQATTIVNAGDPDREGQLLVDEVLDHYKWRGQTMRILLNATDSGSVKKALSCMKNNSDFANTSMAALCRSKADWIVGFNLTRAATLRNGNNQLISIGRVQTPTLALVVRRDMEIANFKQAVFYYAVATVDTPFGALTMQYKPAELVLDKNIIAGITAGLKGKAVELDSVVNRAKEFAPLPYMLATFQKDAEQHLKIGAKATLDVLQSLYEKQLTSYPRTDCEYLPAEQAGSAIGIATALVQHSIVTNADALIPLMKPSSRIYNSSKVTEHHGIIPTGKIPSGLTGLEQRAFELICSRFVMGLLPDFEYEETKIAFTHNDKKFTCAGDVPLNTEKSWRALSPKETNALAVTSLPTNGNVSEVETKTGKTTPPKPYTEASLIADMRSIAKYVTDEKLKAVLKETSGIGTAATQAGIIETLKQRKMIELVKRNLVSTEFGREVIKKIPPALTDPGVTASWEDALDGIAKGTYKADDFMRRIGYFVENQLKAFGCEKI